MPLTPGAVLGPYEIVALLGAGGMGEVYRARDTKLNRQVAIKLLSPDLADAAARRRFQREAETASSLNHPHIVSVHDAGEADGRQYLGNDRSPPVAYSEPAPLSTCSAGSGCARWKKPAHID